MSPFRSTLLLLRLPFSLFLLPIYLAGIWAAGDVDPFRALVVGVALHLLVYPASNGFNSYYDRDEGPIGGLASPPPVHRSLLAASLALDAAGLALAFMAGPVFALAVLMYGCFSKLYSWPPVRLKRMPVAGWLATGLGQGGLTLVAVALGSAAGPLRAPGPPVLAAAALVGVLLLGVFPLTQVYQHGEDARRGDRTISLVLGVRGTFVLSGACLGVAVVGLAFLVARVDGPALGLAFLGFQALPSGIFLSWARAAFRDPAEASHRRAMHMNIAASAATNAFFALALALRAAGS